MDIWKIEISYGQKTAPRCQGVSLAGELSLYLFFFLDGSISTVKHRRLLQNRFVFYRQRNDKTDNLRKGLYAGCEGFVVNFLQRSKVFSITNMKEGLPGLVSLENFI